MLSVYLSSYNHITVMHHSRQLTATPGSGEGHATDQPWDSNPRPSTEYCTELSMRAPITNGPPDPLHAVSRRTRYVVLKETALSYEHACRYACMPCSISPRNKPVQWRSLDLVSVVSPMQFLKQVNRTWTCLLQNMLHSWIKSWWMTCAFFIKKHLLKIWGRTSLGRWWRSGGGWMGMCPDFREVEDPNNML